jgi:hypothetical protein
MYRKHHNGQLSIEEIHVPFGGTLVPENRWREREAGAQGRHHLDPSVVQKAVKRAVLGAGVAKAASCHTFRHPSRHTCWNGARTSAPSRSFSATRM